MLEINEKQPPRISEITQGANVEGLIVLWTLDLTHMEMGYARFIIDLVGKEKPVFFGGNQYLPWPIDASGFEKNSQGASPRPTMTMSAVHPIMTSLIISANELQGSKVTRMKTFRRFLDDGVEPDATMYLPLETYRIERISDYISGKHAVFELASPLDMEDSYFPKRQIIRDYCNLRYRIWSMLDGKTIISEITPCPYAGSNAWDKLGNPTTIQLDVCAKSVAACKLRFGANAVLPGTFFPGVAPLQR